MQLVPLFLIQSPIVAAEEVGRTTASSADHQVDMLALRALGQVGRLFAALVFNVPSINSIAVKVVDNQFEIAVRTNKHVVGTPIENDFLVIFKEDLVGRVAGGSELDAR